jgi:hypothetical protein
MWWPLWLDNDAASRYVAPPVSAPVWSWPARPVETSGPLDKLVTLKASPGEVELTVGVVRLMIPADAISSLITRLETARDAAALMAAGEPSASADPHCSPEKHKDKTP